jgi:hypothetical protein
MKLPRFIRRGSSKFIRTRTGSYRQIREIIGGELDGAVQIKTRKRWKWLRGPRKRISSVPHEGIGVVPCNLPHEDSRANVNGGPEATPREETQTQTIRPITLRGYEIVVWTNKYRGLREMR